MSRRVLTLAAADEPAMVALGGDIAQTLAPGMVVYLDGELGLGKTTLCRGIIQGLGHGGAVKSPTYTLVEPYQLDAVTVYHFDLYRLSDPEELEFLGIRDYFTDRAICLIEWPGRGRGHLPAADWLVGIEVAGAGRRLRIVAASDAGEAALRTLMGIVPGA